MIMTQAWLENRLKELDAQLAKAELTRAAVEGAIQECVYHLDQLKLKPESLS